MFFAQKETRRQCDRLIERQRILDCWFCEPETFQASRRFSVFHLTGK